MQSEQISPYMPLEIAQIRISPGLKEVFRLKQKKFQNTPETPCTNNETENRIVLKRFTAIIRAKKKISLGNRYLAPPRAAPGAHPRAVSVGCVGFSVLYHDTNCMGRTESCHFKRNKSGISVYLYYSMGAKNC